MWGVNGHLHDQQQVLGDPYDDEDGFQVVYDDHRSQDVQDTTTASRAGHLRYLVLPQAGSAVKAAAPSAAQLATRAGVPAPLPASPAHSGGRPTIDSRRGGTAAGHDQPQQTLAQELRAVLGDIVQPEVPQQPGQQVEVAPVARRPGSGRVRPIRLNSPAVPAAADLPPAPGERPSSGRRWHPRHEPLLTPAAAHHDHALAGVPRPSTAASDGAAAHAKGSFFEVDADLLQAHAQHQQAAQRAGRKPAQRRTQQRTVHWDSPQAASQHERPDGLTPQPSQRGNPLAALLGGDAASQRIATTGAKQRGRHPIYGQVASPAGPPESSSTSSGGRMREVGLRDATLTSPRQAHAQWRRQQHRHSRFASHDTSPGMMLAAAGEPAAAERADAGLAAGFALSRLLPQQEPASAVRQQSFQPRPQRPPSPGEVIEDEEEQGSCFQQQQQQQHAHDFVQRAEAQADAFHTPAPPPRRFPAEGTVWSEGLCDPVRTGALAATMARMGAVQGIAGSAADAPATGDKAMSLQRSFVAQLQPVSRPVAAATLQQQRQRLAGAAGLHARMQAILAAERAGLAAQSPLGTAVAGPRLSVLSKELEASLTKCHCRCDQVAAEALGHGEVVALIQNRSAREVDTAPGSVLLLREVSGGQLEGGAAIRDHNAG